MAQGVLNTVCLPLSSHKDGGKHVGKVLFFFSWQAGAVW